MHATPWEGTRFAQTWIAMMAMPKWDKFENASNSWGKNQMFMKFTAVMLVQTWFIFEKVCGSSRNDKNLCKNNEIALRINEESYFPREFDIILLCLFYRLPVFIKMKGNQKLFFHMRQNRFHCLAGYYRMTRLKGLKVGWMLIKRNWMKTLQKHSGLQDQFHGESRLLIGRNYSRTRLKDSIHQKFMFLE